MSKLFCYRWQLVFERRKFIPPHMLTPQILINNVWWYRQIVSIVQVRKLQTGVGHTIDTYMYNVYNSANKHTYIQMYLFSQSAELRESLCLWCINLPGYWVEIFKPCHSRHRSGSIELNPKMTRLSKVSRLSFGVALPHTHTHTDTERERERHNGLITAAVKIYLSLHLPTLIYTV